MNESIVDMRKVTVDRGFRKNILAVENFTLKHGELAAVVGPNGAGKSTFLYTVNLLLAYHGDMQLFGQNVRGADKTELRRRSAMVFQDMLLLGDSVYNNIAYPLHFRGLPLNEIQERVKRVLSELHCEHLSDRQALSLSGGESQRVCIARALVTDPELLLLDEPFAALDASTRGEMLEEIRQLAVKKGISVLMVSHHLTDVLQFAERVIAIFGGSIVQDDSPERVMRRPVNEQVARLVGMDNILPCAIEPSSKGQVIRLADSMQISFPYKVNKPVSLCCLPGDAFSLYNETHNLQEGWNVIEGSVERITPGLGSICLQVAWEKQKLLVRVPRSQLTKDISRRSIVKLAFNPEEVHLL